MEQSEPDNNRISHDTLGDDMIWLTLFVRTHTKCMHDHFQLQTRKCRSRESLRVMLATVAKQLSSDDMC
eukprot:4960680-Pleurochrysis_carterae.AAC.2